MRMRLAAKIDLAFAILATTAILGVGWLAQERHTRAAEEGLLRRGSETAELLAQASRAALHRSDREHLDDLLSSLAAYPEVAYARIVADSGVVLAARTANEADPLVPPLDATSMGEQPRLRWVESNGVLDLTLPVRAGDPGAGNRVLAELPAGSELPRIVGYVQIGLDRQIAMSRAAAEQRLLLACAIGAVLVALLGMVWVTRRLTGPIRRLAAVSRDISEGHFDRGVPVSTRDEVGELGHAIGVMLDKLRAFRDQAADHQRDLEAQVRERTLELERRTEEAEELARRAEAASRAKSQFLANMSHEIRTPMNGVIGMTELLIETELSQRQAEFASTIHQSARLLLGVISDVLDFSRAEAGKLQLEPVVFDLRESVEDVAELLAREAHGKGLDITCFVDDEVPEELRGDLTRLRQILLNLVGNAVKFTSEGEVVIRAVPARGLGLESPPGSEAADHCCWLEFSVADTGIGIPEASRQQIFDSFTQADGSLARRYGGTGLGLAISQQLVELMDGEIGFESEVGRGSRFWFRLPLGTVDETSRPDAAPLEGLDHARTLIADANPTTRQVIAHHLEGWGAAPEAWDEETELLAVIRQAAATNRPYSMIVVDSSLAGDEGLELVREIRADDTLEQPRLILLASLGTPIGPRDQIELDISAKLTKPVRKLELHRACVAAMRRDAPATRSSPPPTRPATAAPTLGRKIRILLAEDNEVNQKVAVAVLEALECEVHAVWNGEEAVRALEEEKFQLVLMDCQMPGMDGFAATQAIRAGEVERGDGTHLPIVALTAHAAAEDRQNCLDAGMDDYLAKPFTKDELREIVEAWALSENEVTNPGVASPRRGTHEAPLTYDPSALQLLEGLERESGEPIRAELVEAFHRSSTQLLARIRRALGEGDAEAARRAAHPLKSSAAQIGGARVSVIAKDIEASARRGMSEQLPSLVEQLDAALGELLEALTAEGFGAGDV